MSTTRSLPRFAPWLIILLWAWAIPAYTVFEPECTQLKEPVNFVSTPNSRGTLEILWSSLFTIFACTWTIQHPNVPEQRDGRFPGWRGDLHWGLKNALESLKLIVVTILGPEIVICTAWCHLAKARDVYSRLGKFAKEDDVPWTIPHAHYAAMGGFVIRIKKPDHDSGYRAPYHLTGPDLCILREHGHIRLPHITEEAIRDTSKSDPLLKTLALGQILWSILQITVRGTRGLSISLLELSVVAFTACAIIIYVLYWNKPKDVKTAITVQEYDDEIPERIRADLVSGSWSLVWGMFTRPVVRHRFERSKGKPLPNLAYVKNNASDYMDYWGSVFLFAGTVVFGTIHVAGWNFFFPTQAELLLWRCASVFAATFSLIILAILNLAFILDRLGGIKLYEISFTILCALYILARLVILVETFRTLVFLPVNAFESTWTSSIPHFS